MKTSNKPRPEALAMVKAILDNSTRDITGDDLKQMVKVFDELDAAHRAMRGAWAGTPEQFLAATERLRECDRRFWVELEKLVPLSRDRLEAMIEGDRVQRPMVGPPR